MAHSFSRGVAMCCGNFHISKQKESFPFFLLIWPQMVEAILSDSRLSRYLIFYDFQPTLNPFRCDLLPLKITISNWFYCLEVGFSPLVLCLCRLAFWSLCISAFQQFALPLTICYMRLKVPLPIPLTFPESSALDPEKLHSKGWKGEALFWQGVGVPKSKLLCTRQ